MMERGKMAVARMKFLDKQEEELVHGASIETLQERRWACS